MPPPTLRTDNRPPMPLLPHPTPDSSPSAELMHSAAVALSEFFDGHPVPTFAIDAHHVITHWNKACEQLLGWSRDDMIGTSNHWQAGYSKQRPVLADLILDGDAAQIELYYPGKSRPSTSMPDAWEVEDFFPNIGASGQWLHLMAAPLRNGDGDVVGAIETLRDVTERRLAENALRRAHDNLEHLVEKRTAQLAEVNGRLEEDIRQRQLADAELRRRNIELTELNSQLSMAQQQLLQAEKLASIGQLAAGVAHEINNPIGYIFSNFGTLQTYLLQLFDMLDAYQQAESAIGDPAVAARLRDMRATIDLDYLRGDIPTLMSESKEGIVRVRHIVQDLKDFSRVDANQEWVWADLHQGIDSTATRCGSPSPTPAAASRRTRARASSTPSSPPRRSARAPGWACRWPTASCKSTAAASPSRPSWAKAPCSASTCPSATPPTARRPR